MDAKPITISRIEGNQLTLRSDIARLFQARGAADFVQVSPPDYGRIETRRIWCSTALNSYLDFPHVGQVFLISMPEQYF